MSLEWRAELMRDKSRPYNNKTYTADYITHPLDTAVTSGDGNSIWQFSHIHLMEMWLFFFFFGKNNQLKHVTIAGKILIVYNFFCFIAHAAAAMQMFCNRKYICLTKYCLAFKYEFKQIFRCFWFFFQLTYDIFFGLRHFCTIAPKLFTANQVGVTTHFFFPKNIKHYNYLRYFK